jgi:2-furoyl-CoA dehydrogenase large subunit
MDAATARASWVGTSVPRVEDEALLRGEGRFLDDAVPAPGAHHAAIVRSQVAHARVRVDPSPALEHPGVTGILTGGEVRAMSRPFPAALDSGVPYYAAASETTRYAGEPLAVVVARDRYAAEDAAELVSVDYEPLEPVVDLAEAVVSSCIHDRTFHYGDVDEALAQAELIVRATYPFPRFSCTPVECFAVTAAWSDAEQQLTAWANFQGPFTLHGVAAAALGLRGNQLRIVTPLDSGGSFGIKSAVYVYVVLLGLAARKLGVPVHWVEDRAEHLLASSRGTERLTTVEAGFTNAGELVALRYDMVEDVGAYVRAPEPATLYRMHGSLSGAYRVRNVAARYRIVLTNTQPSGLNRGFGGPQLYFALERTMATAARRLGLDPVDLARRNLVPQAEMPYRTPSGALYDSGDYEACLDDVLALAGYDDLRARAAAARAAGRRAGIGIACVVEPSISNMGYITLAQTAVERAGTPPKSGNADGCLIVIDPGGGVTVRLGTTPQGQGHRTVIAQVVADELEIDPLGVHVASEMDTTAVPWTVASGNYSSRFSGVAVGAAQAAARRLRAKIELIREQLGEPEAPLRKVAGAAHWDPEGLPDGMEPGLAAVAYHAAPNLDPPDAEDRVASSAAHGFIVDVCAVEIDHETWEVKITDYVTVHDAGRLLNPLLADGQVHGGFAHGAGVALFERLAYDEAGNLVTASFMDYLTPTAADLPRITIGHRSSPSPFTALGAKGIGEGNTMSAPAAIANAVADALGIDHVELPLSPTALRVARGSAETA